MPYRSSSTLPNAPDLKIFLTGQLILKPNDDGSQCDIRINRAATNHQFSMEVRQKMIDPDKPDVIIWRHVGVLMEGGVQIDLERASINGVRRFVPTLDFFRDRQNDDQDFRWIVDLESPEFHNGKITLDDAGTEPTVVITDGVFYTAMRTDPAKLKVERITEPDPNGVPFYSIASLIGVNIYLDRGQKFKLTWNRTKDEPDKMTLDKPAIGSGIKYYEIWINNNPVDISPDAPPTHGELREYYKVVDKVTVNNQETENFTHFELKFTPIEESAPEPAQPNLGTPTIPCMAVGSGGS